MTRNRPKIDRRVAVWKKTGGVCSHCGRSASSKEQTIDHYVPKSWGGGYDIRNLMPLCKRCNQKRGTKPIDAYTFYKFASLQSVRKCIEYEDEFNHKYRSMSDSEQSNKD